MIPKIIHYCWFGKNPKNNLINKCIESWKKYCPDYEIKEWNEDLFDVKINKYVKEAYKKKKWAFVSDYVRLHALYTEGGIYIDTDAEITQNIDEFLIHKAFSSQEDECHIPTALMGAEKGNPWIGRLLFDYNDRSFILENGELDLTTNVERITSITKDMYNVNFNNSHIILGDDINIYPKEYFCMLDIKMKSKNYCIHHFNSSWVDPSILKKELITYKNNYMTLSYIINDTYSNNMQLKSFLKGKTFAIYGLGTIGKLLLMQCKELGLNPKYIIDKKYNEFNNFNVYKQIKSDMKCDILIITPIMYYNEIYEAVDKCGFDKIVNINKIYEKENLLY